MPDNLVVYKNVHLYKSLYKGMYFGGRALLADFGSKLIMRQVQREKQLVDDAMKEEVAIKRN